MSQDQHTSPKHGALAKPPDEPQRMKDFITLAVGDSDFRAALYKMFQAKVDDNHWKKMKDQLETKMKLDDATAVTILNQMVLIDWTNVHGMERFLGRAEEADIVTG
jgi:hypothetical protein